MAQLTVALCPVYCAYRLSFTANYHTLLDRVRTVSPTGQREVVNGE